MHHGVCKGITVNVDIEQFSNFPKEHCPSHIPNSPPLFLGDNHTIQEDALIHISYQQDTIFSFPIKKREKKKITMQ